jgi:hypothetical protein
MVNPFTTEEMKTLKPWSMPTYPQPMVDEIKPTMPISMVGEPLYFNTPPPISMVGEPLYFNTPPPVEISGSGDPLYFGTSPRQAGGNGDPVYVGSTPWWLNGNNDSPSTPWPWYSGSSPNPYGELSEAELANLEAFYAIVESRAQYLAKYSELIDVIGNFADIFAEHDQAVAELNQEIIVSEQNLQRVNEMIGKQVGAKEALEADLARVEEQLADCNARASGTLSPIERRTDNPAEKRVVTANKPMKRGLSQLQNIRRRKISEHKKY